jgi:hypothetical protein
LSRHVIGVDLGKVADHSAMAVVERVPQAQGRPRHVVAYLRRWELMTAYASIVAEVAALVKRPPLCTPTVLVDATGVGSGVFEDFRRAGMAAALFPVVITGGHVVSAGKLGGWNVPQKDLVAALTVCLESGRLDIADVPEREVLRKELRTFSAKITESGNLTYEALREREHDDLVLACALACWWAERPVPCRPASGGTRPDLSAPAPWLGEPGSGY